MWMEAWSLYLSVIANHNPSRALEILPYQSVICTANKLLSLNAWLQYDAKFHTLAATQPSLHWDQKYQDFWMDAHTANSNEQHRWPCPYCRSASHYPENCPKLPFLRANHLINLPILDHLLIAHNQFVESTIRDAVQDLHANIATSAYHAKVITSDPNVLETGVDPLCESHLAL